MHWLSPGHPSQLTTETTDAACLAEKIYDYWKAEINHSAGPAGAAAVLDNFVAVAATSITPTLPLLVPLLLALLVPLMMLPMIFIVITDTPGIHQVNQISLWLLLALVSSP